MIMSFSVPLRLKENIKTLVRSYETLRFEQDPFDCFGSCQFRISGDVNDFNRFNQDLYAVLEKDGLKEKTA